MKVRKTPKFSVTFTESAAKQLRDDLRIIGNIECLYAGHRFEDAIEIQVAIRYERQKYQERMVKLWDNGVSVGLA